MANKCHYSNIPCLDGEEWRPVVGYEGLYFVSNKGRIWSAHYKRVMRIVVDRRNRCTIGLRKDGKAVGKIPARLVATAFIREPMPGEQVNHIDENPLNNCVENLEWCDSKYNCNYGTRNQRIKEKLNMAVMQYTLDGEYIASFVSLHEAADAIGADAGHICDCCNGNRAYAYGYYWRYVDDALYKRAVAALEEKQAASRKSRADKFAVKALNVVQLSLDGEFIQVHQSTKLAAMAVGGFTSGIINCCNGKSLTAAGYKWKYERDCI